LVIPGRRPMIPQGAAFFSTGLLGSCVLLNRLEWPASIVCPKS
jgi:hypothetical protein